MIRGALTLSLTPRQWGNAPAGRKLLRGLPQPEAQIDLIMDKAYEGDETRQLAFDLGFSPVVPPKRNRCRPWSINDQLYRRRNEIERLFRTPQGLRGTFQKVVPGLGQKGGQPGPTMLRAAPSSLEPFDVAGAMASGLRLESGPVAPQSWPLHIRSWTSLP